MGKGCTAGERKGGERGLVPELFMALHSLPCCCPYFLICVGTLNKLDGELVVLDGLVYQQAASGACRVVGPEEKVGASHAWQPLAHRSE